MVSSASFLGFSPPTQRAQRTLRTLILYLTASHLSLFTLV